MRPAVRGGGPPPHSCAGNYDEVSPTRRPGTEASYSATYRLFKLNGLETACEDYGQAVRYKGTIENNPHFLQLDGHHKIETGKLFPVCGNTYRMLNDTRFKSHFEFFGSWDVHYGIFPDCGTPIPFQKAGESNALGACC